MSGINTGAYPAGQNQDWEQIAIDATTLNGDLNALNQDVNELETNTDAIVDGYGTIIDNSTTLVAEGQVYTYPYQRISISNSNILPNVETTLCVFNYAFTANPANSVFPVAYVGAYLRFSSVDEVSDISQVTINLRQVGGGVINQDCTFSRVNNAGIINASFASMIQSTSTTPQTYSLSVIVASAGNSNIGSNSYGWLLPMSAPIVP